MALEQFTKAEKQIIYGYKAGLTSIRKEINLLYEKYSKDGVLSNADLSKYNRLTNLEKNIAKNLNKAYNIQVKTTKKTVKNAFESAFYYNAFDMEQKVKMPLEFGLVKKEAVNAVVEGPHKWTQLAKGHTKLTGAKIRDAVMQGVVQGKDVTQVTKQITNEMNIAASKAVRIARTETHRAQIQGSIDSYKKGAELGVEFQKVWVATLDDRTRETHAVMDGQKVDKDEKFVLPSGGTTEGPGLSGIGAEDINCRCAIRAEVKGFEPTERRSKEDGIIKQQTFQEWAKDKGIKFNNDMANSIKDLLKAQGASNKAIAKVLGDETIEKVAATKKMTIEQMDEAILANDRLEWDKDKQIKAFMKDFDAWYSSLSSSELNGIKTYTGGAFSDMNSYLRGIKATANNMVLTAIKGCKEAMSKAKISKDVVVRRGSDLKSLKGLVGKDDDWLKNNHKSLKGEIIQDKGFMSTSPLSNGGFNPDGVEYRILLPKGSQAMYIDKISAFKGEQEILCNAGTKFRIIDVIYDASGGPSRGAFYTVYMEALTAAPRITKAELKVILKEIQDNSHKSILKRLEVYNDILADELPAPSTWSGKLNIDDFLYTREGTYGIKEWDGAITIAGDKIEEKTLIHELIHARSKGVSIGSYSNHTSLEEGFVDLFANEICKKYDIPLGTSQGYKHWTDAIEELAEKLGKSSYDYSKEMLEIPLDDRRDKVIDDVKKVFYGEENLKYDLNDMSTFPNIFDDKDMQALYKDLLNKRNEANTLLERMGIYRGL